LIADIGADFREEQEQEDQMEKQAAAQRQRNLDYIASLSTQQVSPAPTKRKAASKPSRSVQQQVAKQAAAVPMNATGEQPGGKVVNLPTA